MQIISYFHADNQTHWLAEIEQCDWRAAQFLVQLLREGRFHETLGPAALYLLTDGPALVSFLTLAPKDCVDDPDCLPWIGFVHTAPEYRGHRYAGRLIDHACGVAQAHGVPKVYVCTDHVGLYEKYGFTYLEDRVSIYGEVSRVYARELCDMQLERDLRGKIIFLNGVTSSGKTSIVEALQDREDVYFLVVANDLFEQMVGDRDLQADYWTHLSRVILLMYRTAKMISDQGYNVLIDGILVERPEIAPHYRQMREILGDSPLSIVEVTCPLDVCRARNIARGDRYETQSEEQAALMAKDIPYALRVETDRHTPAECAEQIVRALM